MDDVMIRYRLNELIREFSKPAIPKQKKPAVLARWVKAKSKIIKKRIDSAQELLDYLRICIKYQVFDLEATKRENEATRQENMALKKLLEEG